MVRILVVEDNALSQLVARYRLQYTFCAVTDSVRGSLDMLTKYTFDVMLCDRVLKDGLGFEVLESRSEHCPPAIMYTADPIEPYIERADKAGFVAIANKSCEEIYQALSDVANYGESVLKQKYVNSCLHLLI